MRDWETDQAILDKVERRKTFILGKSTALSAVHVAEMDSGKVRVIWNRRNGETVSVAMNGDYGTVIKSVRKFEFITGELRGWDRSKVGA